MSNKPKVGIPPELESKMGEQSPAGHLFFYINSEGSVQINTSYDCELSALALQNFASLWSKAVGESQKNYFLHLFNHVNAPKEDSSEE